MVGVYFPVGLLYDRGRLHYGRGVPTLYLVTVGVYPPGYSMVLAYLLGYHIMVGDVPTSSLHGCSY